LNYPESPVSCVTKPIPMKRELRAETNLSEFPISSIKKQHHPGGFPDCDPIHLFEIQVVRGNISNSVSVHDIETGGQYAYVEPRYFCDCVFAFFRGLLCLRILFQEFHCLSWPCSIIFCSFRNCQSMKNLCQYNRGSASSYVPFFNFG